MAQGEHKKQEFKAGDVVFEPVDFKKFALTTLKYRKRDESILIGRVDIYSKYGLSRFGYLHHATPESRAALVQLYGEDNVPKLPLSRHEIIVELLKRQGVVLCKVSDSSYENALNKPNAYFIDEFLGREDYCYFMTKHDCGWRYAIAVDLNGNEITELPEVDDE